MDYFINSVGATESDTNGYKVSMDKVVDGYRVYVYCSIKNNNGFLECEDCILDRQKAHETFIAYVTWYGQGMYKYYGTRPTEEWRKEHKEW